MLYIYDYLTQTWEWGSSKGLAHTINTMYRKTVHGGNIHQEKTLQMHVTGKKLSVHEPLGKNYPVKFCYIVRT